MTDTTQIAKRRRLGRGLGSLMSTPVPIDRSEAGRVAIEVKPPEHHAQDEALPQHPASQVGVEVEAHVTTSSAAGDDLPQSGPISSVNKGSEVEGSTDSDSDRIAYLPLDRVVPNPHQPRQDFDESALEALSASIRSAGVMQPIVVRPEANGLYTLIAGERRWRAAGLAGLTTIPALVRRVDDHVAAEWALIENLQREDLNPMEKAEAFLALVNQFALTHAEIAERVGLDRSSVSNILRLNELDDFCRDSLRQGSLSMGHARALLAVTTPDVRRRLAQLAVRHGWSVRETERQVALATSDVAAPSLAGGPIKPTAATNRHIEDLESRLSRHLGTRVRIQPSRRKGRGKIIIDFYSLDEFDGLMQRIGFDGGE